MASVLSVTLGGLAIIGSFLAFPVRQRYVTLGFGRPSHTIVNIHGVEPLRIIENTIQCEDLHHEKTTNKLFAACQDNRLDRSHWFPPLTLFEDPSAVGKGAIIRVDPESFKSTALKLKGSPGPMVTHGIDILNDPDDSSILWIYVVNHLPNPERWFDNPRNLSAPPERAQIEVFKHRLGTDEAEFIRSVRHADIRMPNDILAVSPTSFYVSNDHVNFEGIWRILEDVGEQHTARSSSVVHVSFQASKGEDPSLGVDTTLALNKIHNSNGLGRGSPHWPEEACVIDASGGVLNRVKRDLGASGSKALTVLERIQLDSSLDNPSYYVDPYATEKSNASGYILPGLANAANLGSDFPHLDRPMPSLVWHVRGNRKDLKFEGGNKWEKRLIFQDNGKKLRSASGAVMISIDPKTTGGKKQAWLFVTGFGSEAMVAAKVDL